MAKDQPYYFSHDVNASSDPKIVAMVSRYGTISYAWWWLLIEKLATSEDYKLPFKKYTFIALDKELEIERENERPFNENERPFNENERPFNENEQSFFCKNKSFFFINSLIYDFELLECDDEYFWSPSLIRRQEDRKSKFEKKQEQCRLAGIKSGEARRKKERKGTDVQRDSTDVQRNEQKKRKEKKNIEEEEERAPENLKIYKAYMNKIGTISPIIKERLDELVEEYGIKRALIAIDTSSDNHGNSIKYVETVAKDNMRKEVQTDLGTAKRNSRNRTNTKDEQVDWQAEYERVHGKQ
ncbi:Lin1244/Lin1753 domain-containing protein [Veillonella montpellierensis]|uniref:Lin1244/Lin1753 domain-containing protein n=1 Tax=Veillonella montpellierensis TaxID=187328 RepID=UPI0023F64319|nr:Lin1244/Lin1753 domain-containing protein [Veillonella montpellierensis]